MKEFGILKKVELRDYWRNEAGGFTPWLATESNMQLLGETIGMELEVQSQEESVGPFRADILCLDTVDDSYVLVENQLEKTDHTHLGQLMTYASGLEAVTIIWVAKRFTEEHRAALDWLNSITEDRFKFFGLEIELYQIGESPAAPLFKIVSKPNDWSRSVRRSAENVKITDTKLLQQEYWTDLKEYLEEHSNIVKPQKPLPQHWTNFAIGRSHFHLSATVNTRDNIHAVWLNIQGEHGDEHFQQLREEYESESKEVISPDIDWRELEGKKTSVIVLETSGDILDKEDWENQFEWHKNTLEAYTKFFKQKIKDL